ncbi:hypothetical protein EVAR_55694_1 [Eumeta japonica]|uniref:Uncharacterized protein n=1 Tax=Eumeta variegata TaxID=151549 RepID=A0A4C1ZF33_EUMVA|nr:hypothetical protein EVAR_55694_1 [Eumeta japonica]
MLPIAISVLLWTPISIVLDSEPGFNLKYSTKLEQGAEFEFLVWHATEFVMWPDTLHGVWSPGTALAIQL